MAVRPSTSHAVAVLASLLVLSGGCAFPAASGGTDPQSPAPAGSTPSSTPTGTPTPTPAAKPANTKPGNTKPGNTKPRPAPTRPKHARPAALLRSGDSGTKVRELQHRLRQLEWFSGRITGRYRASTVRAVKGFQDRRDLGVTGAVDEATWTSLLSRTRKPTDAELHNRLTPGPALLRAGATGHRVRELQARLKQIGWFGGAVTGTYGSVTTAAVRGFQGKRAIPVTGEVDQRTWDRLTAMTRMPTSDALSNRTPKPSARGLDARCLTGRALCISKTTDSLVWVIDGHAQLRTDVRFGSAELPTREGAFRVGWKSRHHVSTIYHTSMPYAMFFSGGQAVHYSSDFAARGYNGASHGCVNVRNLSAIQTLFAQVRVGDKVIVYR